jgi:RNA 2',3'-cyclic 3'-phosphodiesterase
MRLFVAVDPSAKVRAQLKETLARLAAHAPNAKWVRPESLHVTLAFLGYVDDRLAPEIAAALGCAAARHEAVRLRLSGGGAFGSTRRPRVLWVGLEGAIAELAAIHGDVEEALIPFGYEPEQRAFKPHLTLARARDPRGDAALTGAAHELAASDFGRMRVGHLVLYRSDLSPAGARHTALSRAPLGADRDT